MDISALCVACYLYYFVDFVLYKKYSPYLGFFPCWSFLLRFSYLNFFLLCKFTKFNEKQEVVKIKKNILCFKNPTYTMGFVSDRILWWYNSFSLCLLQPIVHGFYSFGVSLGFDCMGSSCGWFLLTLCAKSCAYPSKMRNNRKI